MKGRRWASTWLIASLLVGSGVSGSSARAQTSSPNDPAFEFQWAHSQIGVQEAWATGRGRGATVAVLDTGVHFGHEDLKGQLLSGVNVVRPDRSAQDDNGQGTHVAGIIAAVANNKVGIAGVAPEAHILPVKVLDDEDEGVEGHVLQGIRYAIERQVEVLVLDLDRNIELSEGGSAFETAIDEAWAAGVVPVLSAEHPHLLSRDFADAPALVVAGANRQGEKPGYSDANGVGAARWGLAAPGGQGDGSENDILSTYWPHSRQRLGQEPEQFGRYVYDSDNIQAAAHVAAAAAVLRGLGQTPQQTVDRILDAARDAGPRGRDPQFGAGILHLADAVKGLRPAPPSPTSSTTTTRATGPEPANTSSESRPAGDPGATAPDEDDPTGQVPVIGEPAGAAETNEEAAEPEASVTGGLAATREDPMDERFPVLPVIAVLLLVGSATITWALRRRTAH